MKRGGGGVNKGKGKWVSGISTPNSSTIVFHLTRPAGDFNLRMSMPATGPIPPEVGKCFTGAKAGNYGRDLISSGPYMVQGADGIDPSSSPSITPTDGSDRGDRTKYIPMNPTQPPFDDSHVRKAVTLIIDKASLQKAWGGTVAGTIAKHVTPDPMLDDVLKGYDPYKTAGSSGSFAQAAAEM